MCSVLVERARVDPPELLFAQLDGRCWPHHVFVQLSLVPSVGLTHVVGDAQSVPVGDLPPYWHTIVKMTSRKPDRERWLMKAAECNPELSSKYRTNRAIGRPRRRWEDDINEFFKLVVDETENFTASSIQINKTWLNTAKDRGRWALLEENYTMTSEERHENNARTIQLRMQYPKEDLEIRSSSAIKNMLMGGYS